MMMRRGHKNAYVFDCLAIKLREIRPQNVLDVTACSFRVEGSVTKDAIDTLLPSGYIHVLCDRTAHLLEQLLTRIPIGKHALALLIRPWKSSCKAESPPLLVRLHTSGYCFLALSLADQLPDLMQEGGLSIPVKLVDVSLLAKYGVWIEGLDKARRQCGARLKDLTRPLWADWAEVSRRVGERGGRSSRGMSLQMTQHKLNTATYGVLRRQMLLQLGSRQNKVCQRERRRGIWFITRKVKTRL